MTWAFEGPAGGNKMKTKKKHAMRANDFRITILDPPLSRFLVPSILHGIREQQGDLRENDQEYDQ
jgi:hypothetical protein